MSNTTSSVTTEPAQAVTLKTWIAVAGAMLGAFMAVLNIQITNASLRDVEGGIGTGGADGTEAGPGPGAGCLENRFDTRIGGASY